MNIYPFFDYDGQAYAFEIDNAYIRPRHIARLLNGAKDVTHIRNRKPFSVSTDIHLQFSYRNIDFMVWEPYGDNSRYWIGPEHAERVDVSALMSLFRAYQVPVAVKVLGDLMTFIDYFLLINNKLG